jgi:hypothetical protein
LTGSRQLRRRIEMSRLLQTVSVLSFAAALSAAPVVAIAQQQTTQPTEQPAQMTEPAAGTEAGQAAGQAAGEAKEAAGEAQKAAGEAVESTTEAAGQATEEAAQAADQAGQAAQEAEQAAEQATGGAAEQAAEGAEQAAEGAQEAAEGAEEAAQGAAETTTQAVEGAEAPAEPVEGTITLQDADSILASELIGATVYNAQGEDVGEIDDAIVGLDGTIEGVVIAVGGFLGLGEKSVAVEMQQISVQQGEAGDPQLVIDATRESLEAAPDFMTAEEQEAEAQSMTAPAGGMPPAGTAPMDPAAGAAGTPTQGTGTATQ